MARTPEQLEDINQRRAHQELAVKTMARTPEQVREMVLANTLFDERESQRIYKKFFTVPSRTNRVLLERYGLGVKRVLEIGCGYGHDLIWYGEDSIGLDARTYFIEFANNIGLDMRFANVEDALPAFEKPFAALLCFNLLEHIVAPHLLLMRFRELLEPDGLLCVKVPLTPPRWLQYLFQLARRHQGFDNPAHINFYTPMTARWTLERAGYELVGQHSPAIDFLPVAKWLGLDFLMPSTLVIGKKIPDFQYDESRLTEFNPPYAPDLLPYYRH